MAAPYRCMRGATLVVPLEAVDAHDSDLNGVSIDAGLKLAIDAAFVPPGDTPRAATFAPSFRAAANGVGPGWNLTLTAAQTGALDPGLYVTDGVLTLPGGDNIGTVPLLIRVEQMVSA